MRIVMIILIILVVLAAILGGGYLYKEKVHAVPIGNILEDPRSYFEKVVTVEGEVTERISLVFLKYYKVKDESGEIAVVTKLPMPTVGSEVRVKGMVKEYSIGNKQILAIFEPDPAENRQR